MRRISRRAFTLIELLIVLAISALFSTLAITYSSIGRNATTLSVEASEIAQAILQAKALSITTYTSPGSASCGYGVVFNLTAKPQSYSIFSYSPAGAPPCPAGDTITGLNPSTDEQPYTEGTWDVPIQSGVTLTSANYSDGLVAVLFYPPDPTVFLSVDGTTFQPATANVYLETVDQKNSAMISVNPEGQVSF